MQAESGETLEHIIARKEKERVAGNGLFFWGVGTPPARAIPEIVRTNQKTSVVFSTMLSKPKLIDSSPSAVYRWRCYWGLDGHVHSIPETTLVTSRQSGKRYALICYADSPISLTDLGPFLPKFYRNVRSNAPPGASQVTSLLKYVGGLEGPSAFRESLGYRINMVAELSGDYWVSLADPVLVDPSG
jgi:hypothetical protein